MMLTAMKTREKLLAAALFLSVWLNFGMGTMLARWVREGTVNHSAPMDSKLQVQARDGWLWIEVRDSKGDLWFGKGTQSNRRPRPCSTRSAGSRENVAARCPRQPTAGTSNGMTPEERNELKLHWLKCEQPLQAIHAGLVGSRDVELGKRKLMFVGVFNGFR